jgi:hypothetical protein
MTPIRDDDQFLVRRVVFSPRPVLKQCIHQNLLAKYKNKEINFIRNFENKTAKEKKRLFF